MHWAKWSFGFCEACTGQSGVLVFARRALAGATRLQLPLFAVVGDLVSRRRFLHLPRSNHTLGLIFCISYVEVEYCLCVNRGRLCLKVCTVDVIRKFQISVSCLNKARSSTVIQFHRHYVVSVTLDSVLRILSMQC